MPTNIRIDMPFADAAVGDQLTSTCHTVPAVMQVTMVMVVKIDWLGHDVAAGSCSGEQAAGAGGRDQAGALQHGERGPSGTGVLGDLRGAGLALLLEGFQAWDDHGEQLQDDACRDVRHDPEREDRQLEQRATLNMLTRPKRLLLPFVSEMHWLTTE